MIRVTLLLQEDDVVDVLSAVHGMLDATGLNRLASVKVEHVESVVMRRVTE